MVTWIVDKKAGQFMLVTIALAIYSTCATCS